MFMGEYRHTLDAKNRMIVPSKFRDELGDTFVITKGLDGCLTIYTQEQWLGMMEKLEKLPTTKREARLYIRSLTSKAIECSLDTAGRIQLPMFLKDEAAISKQCVIIGAADHVEIWSQERWNEYDQKASGSFEEAAETLTEFLQ